MSVGCAIIGDDEAPRTMPCAEGELGCVVVGDGEAAPDASLVLEIAAPVGASISSVRAEIVGLDGSSSASVTLARSTSGGIASVTSGVAPQGAADVAVLDAGDYALTVEPGLAYYAIVESSIPVDVAWVTAVVR